MKKEAFKRAMYGIAAGGINTFIALTILLIYQMNPPVSIIWLFMLAGLILGVYFGLSSFIFEIELWSPLKKTIIHFSSSITTYFIIALTVGWVPLRTWPIIITTIAFAFIYAVYWFCFWIYNKRLEANLNKDLQKKY